MLLLEPTAERSLEVTPPIPGEMPLWARVLMARARRLTPPGLTDEDMLAIWERCEGRCAVSGLGFSLDIVGTGRAKRPFAPSLDRVDRHRGYVADNVRLVCAITNFAMNAWGEAPLIELARYLCAKLQQDQDSNAAARAWYARQDARIREAEEALAALRGRQLTHARRRLAASDGPEPSAPPG